MQSFHYLQDGRAHISLSPSEMLYFTLAYDWFTFGYAHTTLGSIYMYIYLYTCTCTYPLMPCVYVARVLFPQSSVQRQT